MEGMFEEWKTLFMKFFVDVIKTKYAVFEGRARRKEFWMFTLFSFIIGVILGILSSIPLIGFIFSIVAYVVPLAILIPSIALGVRRLHDIDRKGIFILLWFIPVAGLFIMIYHGVKEGTPGKNQYGPNPKAKTKN